jgi:hypothetical protein
MNNEIICRFCDSIFSRKDNLTKHLIDNRCNVFKTLSIKDLHDKIDKLCRSKSLTINGNHNNNKSINSHNIFNININIQPIQKIALDHISTDVFKELIEKNNNSLTIDSLHGIFRNYLSNVLCDPLHPENKVVKYIKRYPPTFQSIHEDLDGNIIHTIHGLKDTCELLSDPVLNILKKKLYEFIKKYNKDDQPDFDWGYYEDTIIELRKELKKEPIKKVLNGFLKDNVLNNIEMKLSLEKI